MKKIDEYINSIENGDLNLKMINLPASYEQINDDYLQKLIDVLFASQNHLVTAGIITFTVDGNRLKKEYLDFSCMPNLKSLNVGRNFVNFINIKNLHNLKHLCFNDTKIRYIDTEGLSNIKHINASNTPLVTIDFEYPLDVKYLNVIGTRITEATKIALRALSDVQKIDEDNKLVLDCDFSKVSKILTKPILDSHFRALKGLGKVPDMEDKCINDSMKSLLKIFGLYEVMINIYKSDDTNNYSPLQLLKDYNEKYINPITYELADPGTRANKRFHIG